MTSVKKIFRIVDYMSEYSGKVCYPLILAISFVVLFEIIIRIVFKPTLWTFETTQFLFAICCFLPSGLLQKEKSHITVDIFYTRCSPKTKVVLSIITFPFFLLFVGCMVYFGCQFAYSSVLSLESTGSAWDPPIYPVKLMLPVGALLLFLQGIVNIVRDIENVFFNKNEETK